MSLLNDALRAAEQRQKRTGQPGAYTGQPAAPGTRSRRFPLLAALLGVIAAGLGGWYLWPDSPSNTRESVAVMPPAEGSSSSATGQKEAPPVATEQKSVALTPAETHPESTSGSKSPSNPVRDNVESVSGDRPEALSGVASDPRAVEKAATVSVPTSDKPETSEAATESEPSSPPVKRVRETPEFRDRQLSRDIGELLQSGRTDEAEARLRSLLQQQQAPQSREALARGFLVSGDYQKALDWLPEDAGAGNPNLRVLRARALLAGGNLKAALSTLRNDIPPVHNHPEYLVTLATLLQQAGENQAAAEQWTRLLASDDSRPAWWVGLAIALESQGQLDSATWAYAEAASLPGLSPALSDYVRERLKTLQAG